ncbi:uncharacterized protein LOC114723267 [Neltuma alba]|uniref:uncharacterized protein LOC114723267 n=1 Tax=Neltuma alba TaxID=207710 RepID=UPI0010A575D4|nr:uncharacterized protein LOC114723267 [Prosopis alba]
MKQWKEEEEPEVEEGGLVKRQAHMHVTSTTITTSKFDVQAADQTEGSSGQKNEGEEFIQREGNSGEIEKKTNLHPLDPVISVDSTFFSSVRTESERVGIITENLRLRKELYLESLYQKTPTQGFYCPNCKVCIQKVLLLDTVQQEISAPEQRPSPPDPIRCSSCFSFLIPIGSWLFPRWVQDEVSPIQGVQQPTGHSKGNGKLSDQRAEVTEKIPVQAPQTRQITGQALDEVNTAADSGKIISQPEQAKHDGADQASNEDDHKTSGEGSLFSYLLVFG